MIAYYCTHTRNKYENASRSHFMSMLSHAPARLTQTLIGPVHVIGMTMEGTPGHTCTSGLLAPATRMSCRHTDMSSEPVRTL